MNNNIDISQLTSEDFQDYWSQFLRFYAKETGNNISSKIPISYLDKRFRDEIVQKYDLEVSRYSSRGFIDIVKQLIRKGAIEFETFRPEEKFTEKYEKALSKIISRIEINPSYKIEVIEDRPNEVGVRLTIDIEDWLKLSLKEKERAVGFFDNLRNDVKKFLGVNFGNPAHGGLNLGFWGVMIENDDEWIKNVMGKKIKKEIKESMFGRFIQRIMIKISRNKVELSVVQPRRGGFGWGDNRENFKKFVFDLFQKYGYNKESLDINLV